MSESPHPMMWRCACGASGRAGKTQVRHEAGETFCQHRRTETYVPLARLQEVEGERDKWKGYCLLAEAARVDMHQVRRLEDIAVKIERLDPENDDVRFLRELVVQATDPHLPEPMASGAAEKNSQGTSDSEDKAVSERLREVEEALEAALERVADLEMGLAVAIALADEGWSYASDYFRDKWEFERELRRLQSLDAVEWNWTDDEHQVWTQVDDG